ncbi:MAG: sortase, partial [Acutalibacteraceae bacterium]|nr:sortase [Acutalibacteraceae bacterium]
EENSGKNLIIEGCSADIAKTEESIENELQNLYDDIMGSGPQTIVPNPMSMITSTETPEENTALGELWMDPEDYFDADIPVVALDSDEPEVNEVSQDAYFVPEAAVEEDEDIVDTAKDDIFNMIDMLKAESDESGFSSILSEIESNEGISTASDSVTAASQPVTAPAEDEPSDEYVSDIAIPELIEETDGGENQFDFEDDYEGELAKILAQDEPVINLQPVETPSEQAVTDTSDYDNSSEKLYQPESMSGGLSYFTQEEYEARIQNEEKKNLQAKKSEPAPKKKSSAGDVVRTVVLAISSTVIVACVGFLIYYYLVNPWLVEKKHQETAQQMQDIMVEQNMTGVVDPTLAKDFPGINFPEGIRAKYAHLYAQNEDMRGWIEIPGACPLPIVIGDDNDYYLKRNFEGKRTDYGVPFFDYRMTDFKNLHTNTVIYGHNMRSDDLVFGILENYRYLDWYKETPVIECNTIYGDYTWLVYAAFITNSNPDHDNGYYFPYNFIDMPESEFAQYIEEIDKRKFYTTGVDINTSDKILTLSTCAYDFTDARLVVVARLKREGESVSVDTSRAYENPNPKYPQKWYDVNKKTNPYAEDSRW